MSTGPSRSNAELTDEAFLAGFEAASLEAFSHEDHLRMAFLYARDGGVSGAVAGTQRIRAFATALGAPEKYHATMTVAWARVVAVLAIRSPAADFRAFLAEHPALLRRDLLSGYYSDELLFSSAAREGFVEPDLRPLPG